MGLSLVDVYLSQQQQILSLLYKVEQRRVKNQIKIPPKLDYGHIRVRSLKGITLVNTKYIYVYRYKHEKVSITLLLNNIQSKSQRKVYSLSDLANNSTCSATIPLFWGSYYCYPCKIHEISSANTPSSKR